MDTLDQSEQDVYNLTVQATDSKSGSWSTTGCTIRVLDVNNHRPMFEKPLYTASVYEDAKIGTLVSTLKATDKDKGPNARIRYSFGVSEKKKLPFQLDQDKGMKILFHLLCSNSNFFVDFRNDLLFHYCSRKRKHS